MKRAHGDVREAHLLDFSAPINPLGPPEGVRAVLAHAARHAARYPSAAADELCAAAARHHGVARECVLAGNGSTELIYLVARLFSGQPVRVLTPSFTEYEDACEACGAKLVDASVRPSATFAANPTSPEGRLCTRGELAALAGIRVVDEAFLPFVGEELSLAPEATRARDWIVLRSLTKFYAMPGLRVGYLVAHPEHVVRLRALQPPWSVNALAAAAGIAALEDSAYAERSRARIAELREELAHGLRALGLDPAPAAANYLLCRTHDAGALCARLRERGIAARNCDSFSGIELNRRVRFSVRERAENARLLAALREIMCATASVGSGPSEILA
jgi:threonine-phosphate decarboxylase